MHKKNQEKKKKKNKQKTKKTTKKTHKTTNNWLTIFRDDPPAFAFLHCVKGHVKEFQELITVLVLLAEVDGYPAFLVTVAAGELVPMLVLRRVVQTIL